MKNSTISIILFSVLPVIPNLPEVEGLPSFFQKTESSEKTFQLEKQGSKSILTSDGLKITATLQKPETMPQTDDPSKWMLKSAEKDDKYLFGLNGKLDITVYSTNTGELRVESWISDNHELVAFRQSIVNKTKKQLRLLSLYPLHISKDEVFEFGNIAKWRILKQFRQKNDLPFVDSPGAVISNSISDVETTVSAARGMQNCDPFFIINNNMGNGRNLMIGYQTAYLHLADISFSISNDLKFNGITAKCDFEGVDVPPNGVRTSQWVIISSGDDPNRMISDYALRMREFHNVRVPEKNAPSVYCTWYYHADSYNEETLKGDIAHFKMEHLPFDVFLIDECWSMNNWGDFEANNSFPDGMKQAASQIGSAGYIPGIWTAPFLADHESKLAGDHPEWLLRNSKGKPCTFFMNDRDHYILDLTYPGVCDYLEEQFRKISYDWGFRYFKFDFMRAVFVDSDQQFHDRSATSLEAYRKGLEAIRHGTGDDAYLSVCGGHYGASLGLADTQRSGSDVKSMWNEKELPKYRQNILRTWMADLWHVDPDAMMVRRQSNPIPADRRNLTTGFFTDDEAFTNTLNQFIGGNLITFTEDFAVIDNDRKMLYRHVIPSVNSSSKPIDIFNAYIPEMMVTHISPKCEKLGDWIMLSIINWKNDPREYRIILDSKFTGNLKGDQFLVFDFQSQDIIAQLQRSETLSLNGVSGHQGRLLKIVPWDGESPMFIGTDLNFACGGLEISDIRFESGRITGILDTPWHVPVTLTFWIPSGEGFEMKKVSMTPGQKMFLLDY